MKEQTMGKVLCVDDAPSLLNLYEIELSERSTR